MLRDINARLVIGECDIAAVLLVLTVTGVFMRVDRAMWLCDVDDAVVPALVLGSGSLVIGERDIATELVRTVTGVFLRIDRQGVAAFFFLFDFMVVLSVFFNQSHPPSQRSGLNAFRRTFESGREKIVVFQT